MISIQPLNAAGLRTYLNSTEFARSPVIPIAPLRAHSQLANPRLHPDDVLLLLAHTADGQLVGYLGALPDAYFPSAGSARRCAWLSCLWVSPAHRGQRIAQQLLTQVFAAWNNQIFITEYTAPAEQLYRKTGSFRDLTTRPGLRLYLRADTATLLPPRHPLLARARPLLRLLDSAANAVLAVHERWAKPTATPTAEVVEQLDDEATTFINRHNQSELTRRGATELNWLLRHPWLRSAPAPDADGRRYHFSSFANPFAFQALKVRDAQENLAAVLILARRGQSLKIPYCYHSGNLALVAETLFAYLRQWRIATFTTFQPDLIAYLQRHRTPGLLQRPVFRKFMVAAEIADVPAAFSLQDGDGDTAFT